MGYLEQELSAEDLGDLSVLEASAAVPLSNATQRPGESYASWGARLKAGDAQLAAAQKKGAKTRSGKAASAFNSAHPRGRGGQWIFKSGSNGAEVKGIQSKTGAKTDGQFGRKTTQAVMSFQRRHGLQVDGIVGAQTVAAMRGHARASQVKAGAMSAADRAWLLKMAQGL